MSKTYVDRDWLMDERHAWHLDCDEIVLRLDDIKFAPSADVRKNVYGEWIWKEDRRIIDGYDWQCNVCGSWQRYTSNFCPHCGAKMHVNY